MIPFYFGPATRQLFAIYHPPQRAAEGHASVLMCSPFGHEAIRVHRLYRVIADRLARMGVAVLRFDFFGTSESGGDDEAGEMKGWQLDVLRAHEELARRSQSPKATWLAARLGATLALQAARHAEGLQQLVLWEPILDGPAYIDELHAAQIAMLEVGYYAKDRSWYKRRQEEGGAAITEALGHRISTQFAGQLAALRPDALNAPAGIPTAVFSKSDDTTTRDWSTRENASGRNVVHEMLDHPIIWTSDPLPNQAIVPAEVTKRLIGLIR